MADQHINKLVGTAKHLTKIALQTNMKKVSWFFFGNKDLSVIRADGVFQVRVNIRIHIIIVFIGEHTGFWNMTRQSECCRQDLYSLTCITLEGLWNQMIKFALNTYGLSTH